MAWTAPRSWVPGEMATAALLNTHVRDNLSAMATHTHTGAAGDGADDLDGVDTLTMSNQGGDPGVAGRMQRNGADLKYWNGTAVWNVTSHTTH